MPSSTPPGPRKRLPVKPSEENLRKQAKRLAKTASLLLADAQHRLANEYGCRNWAELLRVVETMNRGADQLANVKRDVEPLPKAVRARDVALVKSILARGAFTQHDLDAGLAHAAWYGGDAPDVLAVRKELFDLLLDHGADPDGQYGSAYGPIVFGTGECLSPHGLQWLIDAGCDVTFDPVQTKYGLVGPMTTWLGTYGRGGNEAKHRGIELLLAHGAKIPHGVSEPILAIHRGDAAELARLLDADPSLAKKTFRDMPYGNIDLAGATLLHCAVEFDEIACINVLLDHHADINQPAEVIDGIGGQTPIFHVINTGWASHLPTLEHLVKRVGQYIDMSVRATWRTFDGPRTNAVTPPEYVLETGNAKWRKNKDTELSILLWLTCQGDADATKRIGIAEILLAAGANPRRAFENDATPLHLAAWRGPIEMVELLLRHNAKEWQTDKNDKKPLDYARTGVAADKQQIAELLDRPVIRDPHFKAAVKAIHASDVATLKKLLVEHPNLVHDRAIEPDCYTPGYFNDPKLLWFIADNPNLIRPMPANSVELAQVILAAGAEPADITYTLELVMTSAPVREANLLRPLMTLLLDHGAVATEQSTYMTLGHGERDAIAILLERGQPVTTPIAAGMGDMDTLAALLPRATSQNIQAALSMAVINNQTGCAKLCLEAGADANAFSLVHTHATPAHQAALRGNVALLKLLVQHGAKLDVKDKLWHGTPLGWAIHEKQGAAEAFLRLYDK